MKKFSVVALGLLACSALAPVVAAPSNVWNVNGAGTGYVKGEKVSAYYFENGEFAFLFRKQCDEDTHKPQRLTTNVNGENIKTVSYCIKSKEFWVVETAKGREHVINELLSGQPVYVDKNLLPTTDFKDVYEYLQEGMGDGL